MNIENVAETYYIHCDMLYLCIRQNRPNRHELAQPKLVSSRENRHRSENIYADRSKS
jgi:hypothetical protein